MKTFKDQPTKTVNDFSKSLGNYCTKHLEDLRKLKTREDCINYFSGIPDTELSTDARDYRDNMVVEFSKLTDAKCIDYIWQILLAGDNNKVIK